MSAQNLIVLKEETKTLQSGSYGSYSIVQIAGTLIINGTVTIECDDFELAATGIIDGNGRGNEGGQNYSNGAGLGGGKPYQGSGYGGSGGGGHYGKGGDGSGSLGGTSYDSIDNPTYPGSGGGGGAAKGGNGGAALRIISTNNVILLGTINCSGSQGYPDLFPMYTNGSGGGGSGGSIWISGSSVSGNPSLSAVGGKGGIYDYKKGMFVPFEDLQYAGGGSGGLIRIEGSDISGFNPTININGGKKIVLEERES